MKKNENETEYEQDVRKIHFLCTLHTYIYH